MADAHKTVEAIVSAVDAVAQTAFVPETIAAHARQFGRDQFLQKMRAHIDGRMAEKKG